MALVDTENPDSNWQDVLALWSRIANWAHYKPTQRELDRDLRQFLVLLWSEKDWLKDRYPGKQRAIEARLELSNALMIVADLANTAKHRKLTRGTRSSASQTEYFGRVTLGSGASRRLHWIQTSSGKPIELFTLLRAALDELGEYRARLIAGVA